MRRIIMIAIAVMVLAGASPVDGRDVVVAALHVHSDLSTGELPLEMLVQHAEQQGLDAILLAENYLLSVEYGVPPFRALTRVVRREPSVLEGGIDAYLARVALARAASRRVLVVPGVEVIPHYHWNGSLLRRELTLHDVQKNLLVFGIADRDALAALPAIGNPHRRRLGFQSVLDAVPALLIVPGVAAVLMKRHTRVRVGRAFMIVRRRRWVLGGAMTLLAVLGVVRGWPFTVDPYPYWQDAGLAPHQELIDAVARAGGVSVWSFPEARDSGDRWLGPFRVRWDTEPYGDDLLRTSQYTAFGAIYEDTTRLERPGEGWDHALAQYVRGERRRPPWAVGESGFHGGGTGKRLGTVQTVFLTAERSESAVLEAFRQGRMYALLRAPGSALALDEFRVAAAPGTARSGETLTLPAGRPLEVAVAVNSAEGGEQAVRVRLVKNGAIVGAWNVTTPVRQTYRETFDGQRSFFRLDVIAPSASGRLLTNPIFVVPG
jgi:hypothetical protein